PAQQQHGRDGKSDVLAHQQPLADADGDRQSATVQDQLHAGSLGTRSLRLETGGSRAAASGVGPPAFTMPAALLYALFFCSGVSGLIYQVVWVREFGNVLGATIQTTSLVVAIFMLGLGSGSVIVG